MSDEKEKPPVKKDSGAAPVAFRSSTLQSLVRPGALSKAGPAGSALPKAPGVKAKLPQAKPKAAFTFTPSAVKTQAPTLTKSSASPPSTAAASSIQNVLAQRLAVSGKSDAALSAMAKRGPMGPRVVSATLQNKLAQVENMRKKKRDGNKSRDILELSWAPQDKEEAQASYTPISLPYVIREDNLHGDARKQTDTLQKKSQRPTLKNVDEANRSAAALFEDDEADFNDVNNWVLVQFPSLLPALDKDMMEQQRQDLEDDLLTETEKQKRKEEKEREKRRRQGATSGIMQSTEVAYQPSSFAGLPEGKLGKILVRKSGKAELVIGEHQFDVTADTDCNFAQDVGCFIPENSEFFFLGRCLKQMNITPDIQRLIHLSRERH